MQSYKASMPFLSVDNFKTLMTIIKNYFTTKHSVNLDDTDIDVKKTILSVMEDINGTFEDKGLTLKELNQVSLKNLKQILFDGLEAASRAPANPKPAAPNVLSRDASVFGQRPMNMAHILPEVHTRERAGPVDDVKSTRVDRLFEARDMELGIQPAGIVSEREKEFKAQHKTIKDNPIAEKDVLNLMNTLQEQRRLPLIPPPSTENPVKKSGEEAVAGEIATATSGGVAKKNDDDFVQGIRADLQERQSTFQSDRQALNMQLVQQQKDVDPLDIFRAQTESQKKDMMLVHKDSCVDDPFTRLQFLPQSMVDAMAPLDANGNRKSSGPKMITKDRYVLINSINRDWISQQNRYRYKVKFNQTSQEVQRRPIYRNNRTVPHTTTIGSPGVPNTSGWYDNDGNYYAAYDPNDASLDIVGYEEIQIPIDSDANIQTNFKNIHAIQVTSVVLPMDIPTRTNTTGPNKVDYIHNYDFQYPYVLLRLDEFDDMYDGTDDTIRRAFCHLIYQKCYYSRNGRGYVILTPSQNEKKVFAPTSLPTMPSLHLSLLRPNGDLLNHSKDGLMITKLEYEAYNPRYIKVVTSKYFDKNEFYQADVVVIRQYVLFKLSASQNQSYIDRVNEFVNRSEGHEVMTIGDANDSGFYRSFYIQAPGIFNEDAGVFDVDNEMVRQLVLFNETYDLSGSPSNGFILNMSLQHSISIKIEQKIIDPNQ
jgi:hypothetical protein